MYNYFQKIKYKKLFTADLGVLSFRLFLLINSHSRNLDRGGVCIRSVTTCK